MATIYSEYLDYPDATGTLTIEPMQPDTVIHLTLIGNVTMVVTDLDDGEHITMLITQDATGGRAVTFPTEFKFPGGVAPTLSTGANEEDILKFVVEGGRVLFVSSSLNLS